MQRGCLVTLTRTKLEKEVNELIYRADYSSTPQEKVLGRL